MSIFGTTDFRKCVEISTLSSRENENYGGTRNIHVEHSFTQWEL